jgi:hypothetical protein
VSLCVYPGTFPHLGLPAAFPQASNSRRHHRLLVSLHGWSHSQSDPDLKAPTRAAYRRQRELFAGTVRQWQAAGTFDPGADPDAVAQLLMSITLGFVAQRALAGDADVQAHVDALNILTPPVSRFASREPRTGITQGPSVPGRKTRPGSARANGQASPRTSAMSQPRPPPASL